ncbi:MAG: hypothetical protein Q4B64_03215 [Spirochaetales bacterium]|nr:hypothetical protein [Spirochaetales bacterium]
MVLSMRVANLNTMLGAEKRVLPKAKRKIRLMATEYSFRKIVFCVIKHKSPAERKRADDTKGRQLKAVLVLPLPVPEVALRKNAAASTITQREKILTGNFSNTSRVKISTG